MSTANADRDDCQQMRESILALNAKVAELRQQLAEAETRAIQLYVTLDDATNLRLLPRRDYNGQIKDELTNLAKLSKSHLRAAIPYVTKGGYRDLTSLLASALEGGGKISVMFRRPETKVDLSVHRSFLKSYRREINLGRLLVRYMGEEGRNGLHAKVVIADEKEALVSSANLTGYALTKNVEVGLATPSTRIVHALAVWFDTVFESAATPEEAIPGLESE